MKPTIVFFVFLFGVMAGYGWQHYHHKLLVGDLKLTIDENQQNISEIRERVFALQQNIQIEQTIQKIIICESMGKHNARGDSGKSYGPAQFQQKTFNWMKSEAGWTELQWTDPEHQLQLLRWALQNGHGNHWTCFRKIG